MKKNQQSIFSYRKKNNNTLHVCKMDKENF